MIGPAAVWLERPRYPSAPASAWASTAASLAASVGASGPGGPSIGSGVEARRARVVDRERTGSRPDVTTAPGALPAGLRGERHISGVREPRREGQHDMTLAGARASNGNPLGAPPRVPLQACVGHRARAGSHNAREVIWTAREIKEHGRGVCAAPAVVGCNAAPAAAEDADEHDEKTERCGTSSEEHGRPRQGLGLTESPELVIMSEDCEKHSATPVPSARQQRSSCPAGGTCQPAGHEPQWG
jgi:hypothetical protein